MPWVHARRHFIRRTTNCWNTVIPVTKSYFIQHFPDGNGVLPRDKSVLQHPNTLRRCRMNFSGIFFNDGQCHRIDWLSGIPSQDKKRQWSRVCGVYICLLGFLVLRIWSKQPRPYGKLAWLSHMHLSLVLDNLRRIMPANALDAMLTRMIVLWFSHDNLSRLS